jgi:regulator of PEP synthase PpsR (kinase-PPPase family)
MILSDSTGLTAKSTVEKMMTSQYNGCDDRFFGITLAGEDGGEDDEFCELMTTKMFPFLKTEDQSADIIKNAREWKTLLIFTFADPKLRQHTSRMCQLSGIEYVDLLGVGKSTILA